MCSYLELTCWNCIIFGCSVIRRGTIGFGVSIGMYGLNFIITIDVCGDRVFVVRIGLGDIHLDLGC